MVGAEAGLDVHAWFAVASRKFEERPGPLGQGEGGGGGKSG
jgi:hypothetical protein